MKNFSLKLFVEFHFVEKLFVEIARSRIIQRAEKGFGPIRKPGSDRIAKKMTKSNITKLKAMFDHKDGVTQAQAANKFKCHQSFITKTLARHTDIQCRKKKRFQ